MSDFSELEFNEGIARLQYPNECDNWIKGNAMNNYHSDLNQLMPIAWKQEIMLNFNMDEYWKAVAYHDDDPSILTSEGYDKDPVEAIRQCLWQIYMEQK